MCSQRHELLASGNCGTSSLAYKAYNETVILFGAPGVLPLEKSLHNEPKPGKPPRCTAGACCGDPVKHSQQHLSWRSVDAGRRCTGRRSGTAARDDQCPLCRQLQRRHSVLHSVRSLPAVRRITAQQHRMGQRALPSLTVQELTTCRCPNLLRHQLHQRQTRTGRPTSDSVHPARQAGFSCPNEMHDCRRVGVRKQSQAREQTNPFCNLGCLGLHERDYSCTPP